MKQTIRWVILAAMLAVSLPALTRAQTGSGAAGECTDENKQKYYTQYYENRKDHQDVAYDAAKKYLAACPDLPADDVYGKTLKKFIGLYEAATRKTQFLEAYDKKNYAEVLTLGKQVLADDPAYFRANVLLGYIGYLSSLGGNTSLNGESTSYAKQAIGLLESGKTPDDWRPFLNKDDALAWLNYSLGFMQKANSPNEAIPYFLKAARLESPLKKNPAPYYFIAEGYETIYAKQEVDYTAKFKDKPETPESKLAQANIDQVVDRTIDAYARAVALSTPTDATTQKNKKEWMDRLTELYKYRNKSDTGLNELVAGILSKPLPEVPMPLTTLPTPPTTGATAPMTPPAGTPGGTAMATPAPTKPGAVSTTPVQPGKTTTTPKTTTPSTSQTTKPKPKANHRRHP
ncbi:MAG: hypothetical protein ABJC05_01300 [Pyrinomonadaceae bacterium]